MTTRFQSGQSPGVDFTLEETRTVNVTAEALAPTSGYKGDTVVYTATVLDNTGAKLPAAFVATLLFNAQNVFSGALDAAVYDQATGELTISFSVPDGAAGVKTLRLTWNQQDI